MKARSAETIILYTVFLATLVLADEHWNYEEQQFWPGKCHDGKHQSPVNLRKDTAERKVFNDLQFKNYDLKFPATIVNTGHSVAVKLKTGGSVPTIRGGGLPHEYVLDHLHFHWESEHTVHSNRHPLELHLVHYAKMFNSTKVAAQYDDGLAVLAVLFDISDDESPAFGPILEKLGEVQARQNVDVRLASDISPEAFMPKDISNFFRYEGSLTTPKCNEAVVWTVFYQVSFISKSQLKYFPSIQSDEGALKSNYRDLQKLNDRVVVFRSSSYNSGVNYLASHSVSIFAILAIYFARKIW